MSNTRDATPQPFAWRYVNKRTDGETLTRQPPDRVSMLEEYEYEPLYLGVPSAIQGSDAVELLRQAQMHMMARPTDTGLDIIRQKIAVFLSAPVAQGSSSVPSATRWISVNDRLPDDDHFQWLVLLDNGAITSEYYHHFEGWATDENITHWQPLPLPPASRGVRSRDERASLDGQAGPPRTCEARGAWRADNELP